MVVVTSSGPRWLLCVLCLCGLHLHLEYTCTLDVWVFPVPVWNLRGSC